MSSYDENLLASAPAATKAQLQGGYTTDLLKEKATPPQSHVGHQNGNSSGTAAHDLEAANGTSKPTSLTPAKVPWYRTKKGIIILAIVALAIVAAIVGGAVGGSKKKSPAPQGSQGGGVLDPNAPSSSSDSTQSTVAPSSTDSAQGGGTVTSTTTTPGGATGTTTTPPGVSLPSIPIALPTQPPPPTPPTTENGVEVGSVEVLGALLG